MQSEAQLNACKRRLRQWWILRQPLNKGQTAVAKGRQFQRTWCNIKPCYLQTGLQQWGCGLTTAAAEIKHWGALRKQGNHPFGTQSS